MSKAKNTALSDAERAVLRDLNSKSDSKDAQHALYDFAVQRLQREDDLEAMRDDLIHHAQVLDALPDALKDQPWARAPSGAIRKHMATLSSTAAKVYLVLLTLVDKRTLTTFASRDTIANLAGYCPRTIHDAFRDLKDHNLIRRWYVRTGPEHWQKRYFTKLLVNEGCDTEADWKRHKEAAI